ncbi:MAG TPA: glycosyltransferase family 2 protein [Candidatus Thiothrix moscowensis]|uniref:glycosyltransferase family 2 protein n=1 Tax=unclassified Thiothrix TaxID=2636184 RepID=UPI0025D622C4|nr:MULTISPECIES: glycosyltransferase family 2 protein [unclassified Thiothrix]HRJ54153.1 glycosyltransferase family 2 protein [Candidatus Thiothrix moscowensis]HRJ94355.1 glycosyltransferase family 2 protein [Candidatus Thiothrix moscowensis]
MPNLISVCIPAYQQPELLQRAIESILIQKECLFEIIITDDSEQKNSLLLKTKDKRIRYIKNKRRLGAVKNWNESISFAEGNIIKILHHDDWFTTDLSLIETTKSIIDRECDITFSACNAVGEKENFLFYHSISEKDLKIVEENPMVLLWGNLVGSPSVIAVRKEVHKPFDPKFTWVADTEYYLNILLTKNISFKYIDKPTVNITTNSKEQLSRLCEKNKLLSAQENIDLFNKYYVYDVAGKHLSSYFREIACNLSTSDNINSILYALKTSKKPIALPLTIGLLRKTLKNLL